MTDILLPVGRMVAGNMYNPNTTDWQGNPLTTKTGANAGRPRVEYFFAVAIAKGQEQHWSQTEWGAQIAATAQQGFPGGEMQRPDFAWKIADGDSQVPNRRGIMPCNKEGYPGHWVVSFSSGFEPKLHTLVGSQDGKPRQLLEPNAVNSGDFIQVYCNVEANGNPGNPGVYINHSLVCMMAYGERIVSGPDASAVGFTNQQLPAGASAVPLAGTFNPAQPQQAGAPVVQQTPQGIPGVPASSTVPVTTPVQNVAVPGHPQQGVYVPPAQNQGMPAPNVVPGNVVQSATSTGGVPVASSVPGTVGNTFLAGAPIGQQD